MFRCWFSCSSPTCHHPYLCHEEVEGGGPYVLSHVVVEEVDPFQRDYVECFEDHSGPHWVHGILELLFDHLSNHLH